MTVSVCIENPMIDEDIKLFSQVFQSNDSEIMGERLKMLSIIQPGTLLPPEMDFRTDLQEMPQ